MSSPFSIFRKNQRVWMAALVVVAMVSFIILPMFSTVMDQQGGYTNNATAVRWKNGSMSISEVETLAASYQRSYQFLDRLARETIQAGGTPTIPGFSFDGNQLEIGLARPNNAQQVVQTRVLAEEARRHGVNIEDKTVDLYIQELTNGRISQQKYLELMRETAGMDLNRFQLYRFIKDEISKQMFLQMQTAGIAHNGMPLVTPTANWENFQRFEQRAKIEAFPVFTELYLDKVTGTPTEKELREIYEKGKEFAVDPRYSPDFGFFRRYEADFEYVRGYVEKFVDAEKKNLTEEQIKAEYDRRVASGEFRVKDEVGSLEPTAPNAAPKLDATQPADATSQVPKVEETKANDKPTETPAEAKPDQSQTPAPATETPAAETPAAETPATETPATETPATETPAEPAPADGGQFSQPSPVRLVAFQEATTETAGAAETDGTKPPPLEVPADSVPASAQSTTPASSDAPASSTPPASSDAPVANSTQVPTATEPSAAQTTPATETPAVPASGAPSTAPESVPTRIQTLDEVRDTIARDLVRIPAQNKLREAMKNAYEAMEKYQQDLQYFLDAERTGFDKNVVKPEPIDLAKIADANGLEYGRTGFLNSLTAQDTDLGKSIFQNQSSFSGVSFINVMMNKQIPKFVPYSFDFLGAGSEFSNFLAWKVEEKDSFVPTFEQAREEVVNAWKQSKARELAKAEAEAVLSKVEEANGWTVLSETDQALVIRPTPFTWLQPPSFFSREITTSLIDDIGEVDNEFMATAFNTKPGDYTIAPSINRDRYFVLKAVERTPNDAELLQKFAGNAMNPASQTLAIAQVQATMADSINSVTKRLQLDMSALSADAE